MDRVNTIKSWYKDCLDNVQAVYSIFINTFGEERVDLQLSFTEKEFTFAALSISAKNVIVPGSALKDSPYTIETLPEDQFKSYEEYFKNYASKKFDNAIIMVHFPEVTISNENGRTHLIRDMYAKVGVSREGKLGIRPQFHRATYTQTECENNYMPSHIPGIPFEDLREWKNGCLGSGPIRDTIAQLTIDNAWELWTLFTAQLDQYVHVESLTGGPYHRMESLGTTHAGWTEISEPNRWDSGYYPMGRQVGFKSPEFEGAAFREEHLKEFTKHLCKIFSQTDFFLAYSHDHYFWGTSYLETALKMSNLFIDWINEQNAKGEISVGLSDLLDKNILRQSVIRNNRIVTFIKKRSSRRDFSGYEGEAMFSFKGEQVRFHLMDPLEGSGSILPGTLKLLSPTLIYTIVNAIETQVNLIYGRNTETPGEANGCFYSV